MSINLHEDHMDTINAKLVADATALEGVTALQATITDLQTNATNHANELLAANKKVEDAQASITDLQSQIEAKETELTTALSLIHISEPTRRTERSRIPSSA